MTRRRFLIIAAAAVSAVGAVSAVLVYRAGGIAEVAAEDRSLQVHVCHGAMREVEVLHDRLLEMFERWPDLAPSDIVVMTPDIEAFAPYIDAVFGTAEPRISFNVSDRSAERESPLALLDALTWDLPPWFLARRRPVLALLGDADAFVPPSDLWGLALAWGAETEAMRGFGHGLPIDPRWKSVAWRINAWLDERCVGSATSGRRLAAAG